MSIHVLALDRSELMLLASAEVAITCLSSSNVVGIINYLRHNPVEVIIVPDRFVVKNLTKLLAKMRRVPLLSGWVPPAPLTYIPVRYRPQVSETNVVINSVQTHEGVLTIFNGLSGGCAVVTLPVPGLEGLLIHNQNCMVVNQTEDISRAKEYLLQHPEEVYRLAKNGQLWLKQNLETQLYPQLFAMELKSFLSQR